MFLLLLQTHILHKLTYPFTSQHVEDKYKHPLPIKTYTFMGFSQCKLSYITWYLYL